MSRLNEQLASLAARTRAWAQSRPASEQALRVRLARPLEGVAIPAAAAEILAMGARLSDGADPQAPWAGTLEAFQRQINACQRCPLGAKRRKFVFGEGDSQAPLVFVGDAPGIEEDASGRPFAGPAGALLDRMIAAMGFKRPDVYLANVLKCRGQAGREPDAVETEACRPYLQQQLALLQPKVIISLGAYSSRLLTGSERPLSELRGRWAEHAGRPLMPTYHPNELLKDPGLKRFVWEDLKQVMKRLQA